MLIFVLFEEEILGRDLGFIVCVGRIIIEIWGFDSKYCLFTLIVFYLLKNEWKSWFILQIVQYQENKRLKIVDKEWIDVVE